MPSNDTKLVVRLQQADKRRIKGMAATQGLTLGQAILQAFEPWALQLQSGGALALDPRPSAGADIATRSRVDQSAAFCAQLVYKRP